MVSDYERRVTLAEIAEAGDGVERRDAVVAAVRAGNAIDAAAVMARVDEQTVRRWLRERSARLAPLPRHLSGAALTPGA